MGHFARQGATLLAPFPILGQRKSGVLINAELAGVLRV